MVPSPIKPIAEYDGAMMEGNRQLVDESGRTDAAQVKAVSGGLEDFVIIVRCLASDDYPGHARNRL